MVVYFFLDRILVISTDFCYFPKMLRRFLKMREKVGMLAVQKCRQHASFKSDHGRLFFLGLFLLEELLVDLLWSVISPWSFNIFYWKNMGGRLFPHGRLFLFRKKFTMVAYFPMVVYSELESSHFLQLRIDKHSRTTISG